MRSRQCKMYQERVAEGLCAQCGQAPLVTKVHCQGCREKHNQRMADGYRKRSGGGKWQAGGRGRPPLVELARREKCKQDWIDIGADGRRKVIMEGVRSVAIRAEEILRTPNEELLHLMGIKTNEE